MTAWYNEIEPFAAAWIRNLVTAGHIARGYVVERDIKGVHSSTAGRRGGFADDRHLWPDWFRLIRECRPPIVFGEQVASPDGLRWFDAVSDDLEGAGYAVGAADLCAASVGAPHIRQRLYFVAIGAGVGWGQGTGTKAGSRSRSSDHSPDGGGLGDPCGARAGGNSGGVLGPEGTRHRAGIEDGGLADVVCDAGPANPWSPCDWIPCSDGKTRPVEPGSFPLAHGVPGRVGRLRAYGNAIVPQVAAQFIRSVMDVL